MFTIHTNFTDNPAVEIIYRIRYDDIIIGCGKNLEEAKQEFLKDLILQHSRYIKNNLCINVGMTNGIFQNILLEFWKLK